MKFTFVQMPFIVSYVNVFNKEDITFTTLVYKSAVFPCVLLFRLSFRDTIADIVTVLFFEFSDSVLLPSSSFAPTYNIKWFG